MTDIRIVDAGGPHEQVTVEFMRRQRFMERMGVSFERRFVTNGTEAVELLMSGQADVAMQVGFGPALAAIAGGAPMRVIAGANLLTVHAVYARDPAIRRLKDLEGRLVGVGRQGALTHQLMHAVLTKHGVDPAKVRFRHMGNSASIFKALQAGEVEAGFGETEVFDHQDHYGVHALEDAVLWRELPQFPNQASFALQSAIADKRDVLVRTLAAHALMYRGLHDPAQWDAFAQAWTLGVPYSPLEEAKIQWRFYQDYHPYAADLLLPEDRLDFMQRLNVEMGLQQAPLPFDAVADMSLAREAVRLIEDQDQHAQRGAQDDR